MAFSLHSVASEGVSYKILQIASRVFYNTYKPVIKIAVNNSSQENRSGSVICRVERDNGDHVFDFEQDFSYDRFDKFGIAFGIYNIVVQLYGKGI